MNAQYERMKERVQEEMKRFFRPEFLNRIDATVVFTPLTKPEIADHVCGLAVRRELGVGNCNLAELAERQHLALAVDDA